MEIKTKNRLVGAVMIAAVAGGLIGCSNDPYRSSGRVMDDRTTKSRVKDALADSPVYKFPHVDVLTYDGIVQLNGFVHRPEQKAVATDLARNVAGVREVINNIALIPPDKAYGGTAAAKAGARGGGSGTNTTTTIITTNPPNPNQ